MRLYLFSVWWHGWRYTANSTRGLWKTDWISTGLQSTGNTSNPDSLLCRTSYRWSLWSGMAGCESWRTVPYNQTQYPIWWFKAQEYHRTNQTKKVRIVDFGDTLAEILRNARKEQLKNRMQYGELYHKNYYREVKDKNRVYYEFYHLDGTENVPEDYKEISFVCLRPDGSLELPSTLGIVCRKIAQKLDGFEGFHFHQLRHTYTSNLLANGAAPKDVQELLGHSDVSTTMNVYAHSTRKAKRESARLLDKVAGND